MGEPLYELLAPEFETSISGGRVPSVADPVSIKYLNRLSTLPLSSLATTEPESLSQSSQSSLLSLQSLCTRNSKSIVTSADHLLHLRSSLPDFAKDARSLSHHIADLDSEALRFSSKYSRSGENELLDRRKRLLLVSRNADRLSDIMELPTLLSSAVSSSASLQTSSTSNNYASALDIHSHIKRLHLLYRDSGLVKSIYDQAEHVMREMTLNLIASLRGQSIKLAAAMRTVGWLRRIAPELDGGSNQQRGTSKEYGLLGYLFLVCRLANLVSMLEALGPLRDLADQETKNRLNEKGTMANSNAWSGGQQTEKYVKRYIEIFREQSFAIVSMYRSIFPSGEAAEPPEFTVPFKSLMGRDASTKNTVTDDDQLLPLPSALATFPLHLVDLLAETLRLYLPNVRDKASRESLLTQVLYCAGSLGRLGGDFSMILASLEEAEEEEGDDDDDDDDGKSHSEWAEIMKKHQVLAGRFEQLARGGNNSEKG